MMTVMSARAYIVDLVEPREVHDAHGMFKAGDYLLMTKDSLPIDTQVKIRFNFPDGNGTFIRGRVKALPTSEGGPYLVRLAGGDDLEWLISRAAPYAEKVARLLAAAAERAASAGPATRPLVPGEAGVGGKRPEGKSPRTKPVKADTSASTPPAQAQTPEQLAPSQEQLVERIAMMDKWVGQQGDRVENRETLQASPAGSREKMPGASTEDHVKSDGRRSAKASGATPGETAPGDLPAEPPPTSEAQASMEERIKALSANQKKKLAISGNRQARSILMKDEDQSLHIWVMKNPGLVEEEVGDFSAMETLSAEALTFLLQSRRWGTCPRVVKNLVLNPQTPPEAIPNLLAFLSVDDLKQLVETPGVRHLVARQARRTLMERSQF